MDPLRPLLPLRPYEMGGPWHFQGYQTRSEEHCLTSALAASHPAVGGRVSGKPYEVWKEGFFRRLETPAEFIKTLAISAGIGGGLNKGLSVAMPLIQQKMISIGFHSATEMFGLTTCAMALAFSTLTLPITLMNVEGPVDLHEAVGTWFASLLLTFPSMVLGMGLASRLPLGRYLLLDLALEPLQAFLSASIRMGCEGIGLNRESGMTFGEQFKVELAEGAVPFVAGRGSIAISQIGRALSKPYQPTMIGFAHEPGLGQTVHMRQMILKAYHEGARSIAVEMPAHLHRSLDNSHAFVPLAAYAEDLGMRVIFLEEKMIQRRADAITRLNTLISEEGGFSRGGIDEAIVESETQMAGIRTRLRETPQIQGFLEDSLEKQVAWHTALTDIRNTSYDLKRYAELWQEWVLDRREAHWLSVIGRERPDLIVSGFGHVRRIQGHIPHKAIITSSREEAFRGLLEDPIYRPLRPVLERLHEEGTAIYAFKILRRFQNICRASDIGLGINPDVPRILAEGFRREPRLDKLLYRAMDRRGWLFPHEDIEFLAMPVARARERLFSILRDSAAAVRASGPGS